jgi:hypothetical protein
MGPAQVEVVTDAAGEEEIELDDSPGAAWRLDVSPLPLVMTASQVGPLLPLEGGGGVVKTRRHRQSRNRLCIVAAWVEILGGCA